MRFAMTLCLVVFATSAQAQNTSPFARQGLAQTEQQLAGLQAPTADDLFALGAVRFLRAIEKTLQFRWQHNAVLESIDLPVLRLPIEANPDAQPFYPGLITDLFTTLLTDLESSRAALSAVPDGEDVALEIDLAELWFDVNINGRRDTGEGVLEVGAATLMPRANFDQTGEANANSLVRFDTADMAWLTAYSHLLSGVGELVIAFDPTEAIATVMNAKAEMIELRGDFPVEFNFNTQFGDQVDQFALIYGAINQQPDASRTRAAHAHFLSMIAENKLFWAGIARESDNVNEWIPNPRQTAALGFEIPPGTGDAWQAILAEGESLLKGELLIPFWRIEPAGGVNLKRLFQDPPPVDIVSWIQGAGLLPYLERGPTITSQNIEVFERMVAGDTLLFALLFN